MKLTKELVKDYQNDFKSEFCKTKFKELYDNMDKYQIDSIDDCSLLVMQIMFYDKLRYLVEKKDVKTINQTYGLTDVLMYETIEKEIKKLISIIKETFINLHMKL